MQANSNTAPKPAPIDDKHALEVLARSICVNNPAQMATTLDQLIARAFEMRARYCAGFVSAQADPTAEIDRLLGVVRGMGA